MDARNERSAETAKLRAPVCHRPMLLTFEGLCGSGKSSVARRVAETLGAVQLPSIPPEFEAAKRFASSTLDVQGRYLLYVSGLRQTSALADGLLANGKTVVVDSYAHRTQAYHGALGAQLIAVESFVRRPDLTLFLDCPSEVRQQRIALRGRTPDPWQDRAEQLTAEILAQYADLPWPTVAVDATGALDQVVDRALGLILTHS